MGYPRNEVYFLSFETQPDHIQGKKLSHSIPNTFIIRTEGGKVERIEGRRKNTID